MITFDFASTSGYQTTTGSYSWAHTIAGGNRLLVVGVSMLSVAGSSVTSITYNGVNLTFIRSDTSVTGAIRTELWRLISPTVGTNNITVSFSASLISASGAQSFNGVDQTTPVEANNGASATNVGAADATVNVTTVSSNAWVVDAVATDDTAITVGAGQTQEYNASGVVGSGAGSYEGPTTPAGTVTMSWTNVGAAATWSISAIALTPAAAPSFSLRNNLRPAIFKPGIAL